MKLAVVILNWHGADDTLACLDSVFANADGLDLDVIVVDNGSQDDSVERLNRTGHPITLHQTGANLGYAGGNNQGLELALSRGADAVCILNNDTLVRTGLFTALLDAALAGGPRAVSPLISYADRDELWFAGAEATDRFGLPAHVVTGTGGPTSFLTGCCILATSEVWRLVGGFEEDLFLIFEDSEWSLRARDLGVELLVVGPEPLLEHRVSASFETAGSVGEYYWTRNALAYLRRRDGRIPLAALLSLVVLDSLRDLRAHGKAALPTVRRRWRAGLDAVRRRGGAVAGAPHARARPIVFGVVIDDVGSRWPGRNLLLEAMADRRPVVLLEGRGQTTSMLALRPSRIELLRPSLYVVRNALPARRNRVLKRLPALAVQVDRFLFLRALRQAGLSDYLLWLTVVDEGLHSRLRSPSGDLVLDVMDPNFLPEGQQEYDRVLDAFLAQADLVFCSAHTLLERATRVTTRARLLPNAGDPEVLVPRAAAVAALRARLPVGERPVVGYLGTVDWRFDAATLEEVAAAMPDVAFVLAGRVNHDQEQAVQRLRDLPNVTFTGQLGYDEGYACVALFDVGIIPFTPGEMNDAINSVKMFMYLLAGVPVVTTWLRESRENDFTVTARTVEEFVAALRHELANDSPDKRAARRAFGEANTWSTRALEAETMLVEEGLL